MRIKPTFKKYLFVMRKNHIKLLISCRNKLPNAPSIKLPDIICVKWSGLRPGAGKLGLIDGRQVWGSWEIKCFRLVNS